MTKESREVDGDLQLTNKARAGASTISIKDDDPIVRRACHASCTAISPPANPTARRNLPVCSLRLPFSPREATGLGEVAGGAGVVGAVPPTFSLCQEIYT